MRLALGGLLPALLGGCSVVPGMTVEPGGGSGAAGDYTVLRIDGQLVERLAKTRAEARTPPQTQPGRDYAYRVGPGDVLSIVVWNHPELTNPFGEGLDSAASGRLVRPDGRLAFPFVGTIRAQGLTLEQIQDRLEQGLQPYIQDPQVNVRVREYRSKEVYVTGEVRKPGALPITDRPLTVLDALSRTGGLTERVPNRNPYGANARRAMLTRDGRTIRIDLRELYRTGAGNRVLRDGDVLHVPDASDSKVFVLGQVVEQASVPLHNGELTLAEAISEAKGIDLATANTEQIYVIRGVPVADESSGETRIKPRIYRLDASDPTALLLADAFPLRPRDVVYVSSAPIARWNRVIAQISPTIRAVFQLERIQEGFTE